MAASNEDFGMRVYLDQREIPWYQRDWVWGSAALLILFTGLVVAWLAKPVIMEQRLSQSSAAVTRSAADSPLATQAAVNQQLSEQIARLEAVLEGDICRMDTDALTGDVMPARK